MTFGEAFAVLKPLLYAGKSVPRATENRDGGLLKFMLRYDPAERILGAAEELRREVEAGMRPDIPPGSIFTLRALNQECDGRRLRDFLWEKKLKREQKKGGSSMPQSMKAALRDILA